MRAQIVVALFVSAVLCGSNARAVPAAIPFVAEIYQGEGNPVNATVTVEARLHAHPTDEAPMWPTPSGPSPVYAVFSDVEVTAGVMSLLFGSNESVPAEAIDAAALPAAGAWLELVVDGEPLSPRLGLYSVPYALRAQQAERIGDFSASELATLADLPDLNGYAQIDEFAPVAFSGDYNDLINAPPGLTPITSVDGLAGGTIGSPVTVQGALQASALVQGGNAVCDESGNCGPTLGQLNCATNQAAIYNGTQWVCASLAQPGSPCLGANEALQWDGSQFSCRPIVTELASQGNAKGFEITDSWGYTWDGLQRAPLPWTAADALCKSLGGRLPTASELYRVSAVVADEVGTLLETQNHWSRTPYTATTHALVRLDTGVVASATSTPGSTVANRFRCVWPNYQLDHFAANHCMGPPGAECWPVDGANGSVNMDVWDRPPLTYMGAQDECLFYAGHIPYQREFAEQITLGLPNGSNEWIFTADTSAIANVNLVRWVDMEVGYSDVSGSTSYSARGTGRRFRCIGVNYNQGVHPNPVPNTHVAPATRIAGDAFDRPALMYGAAVTNCFNLGGHLPYDRDILELVRGGWPNGTNAYLWSADAYVLSSNVVSRWADTLPIFSQGSTERTGGARSSATGFAYRCAYYPHNPQFVAPTQCNFGCKEAAKGSPNPTSTYMDNVDRVPQTFIGAVQTCRDLGGRLASVRDYTEMIRDGLGNGSDAWLWSADQVTFDVSYGNYVVQLKWVGTTSSFNASASTEVRNRVKTLTETAAFRCVWSNELL